jgi:hypothetical protein
MSSWLLSIIARRHCTRYAIIALLNALLLLQVSNQGGGVRCESHLPTAGSTGAACRGVAEAGGQVTR